jgi:hypothetical protein
VREISKLEYAKASLLAMENSRKLAVNRVLNKKKLQNIV